MSLSSDSFAPTYEQRTFQRFRQIAFTEAWSYLILLFIAMPLKYGLGWEMAVKVVGWAHGGLFMAYLAWLFLCWQRYRWSMKTVALAGLASLLPGGPFLMDPRLPRP